MLVLQVLDHILERGFGEIQRRLLFQGLEDRLLAAVERYLGGSGRFGGLAAALTWALSPFCFGPSCWLPCGLPPLAAALGFAAFSAGAGPPPNGSSTSRADWAFSAGAGPFWAFTVAIHAGTITSPMAINNILRNMALSSVGRDEVTPCRRPQCSGPQAENAAGRELPRIMTQGQS